MLAYLQIKEMPLHSTARFVTCDGCRTGENKTELATADAIAPKRRIQKIGAIPNTGGIHNISPSPVGLATELAGKQHRGDRRSLYKRCKKPMRPGVIPDAAFKGVLASLAKLRCSSGHRMLHTTHFRALG